MNAFLRPSEVSGAMASVIILADSRVVKLPVNMGGVFQTVNRVLPEFRGLFRLHIQKHTAVAEDQTKQVLNQRNNRKSLFLVSVALLQNAADLILSEEFLDSGRKTLFIFNIKCYTVHSADPLYVFGILW